jgi:hypothetical protein
MKRMFGFCAPAACAYTVMRPLVITINPRKPISIPADSERQFVTRLMVMLSDPVKLDVPGLFSLSFFYLDCSLPRESVGPTCCPHLLGSRF